MPLMLRKIRKAKWYKNDGVPWLQEGEIQGDALGDLITKSNELSIWVIDDDRSNLDRVVAALGAMGNNVDVVEYALMDFEAVGDMGIVVKDVSGATGDSEANKRWHKNLSELTADKLLALARTIDREAERTRATDRQVARLVRSAIESGSLDRRAIQVPVLEKMERLTSPPAAH